MAIPNDDLQRYSTILQEAINFRALVVQFQQTNPVPAFGFTVVLAQLNAIINTVSAHLRANL